MYNPWSDIDRQYVSEKEKGAFEQSTFAYKCAIYNIGHYMMKNADKVCVLSTTLANDKNEPKYKFSQENEAEMPTNTKKAT